VSGIVGNAKRGFDLIVLIASVQGLLYVYCRILVNSHYWLIASVQMGKYGEFFLLCYG